MNESQAAQIIQILKEISGRIQSQTDKLSQLQ